MAVAWKPPGRCPLCSRGAAQVEGVPARYLLLALELDQDDASRPPAPSRLYPPAKTGWLLGQLGCARRNAPPNCHIHAFF